MQVNIKKLDERAIVPVYSKPGDAGLDLTAIEAGMEINDDRTASIVYRTGLSIEIPEGYVGLLFPRSSISGYSLNLSNSVGVIDSGYRGEIISKFKVNTTSLPRLYEVGDRFAQLIIIPYPQIEFNVIEELTETERGEGGFGSTNINNDLKTNENE